MKVYIGTSGWRYSWNPDGLEWYARETGFNAVELNMSFYGFPRPGQVERWASQGAGLRWSVKVHRSITHMRRLNEKSIPVWERFRERFSPLERLIDFYLFQLPPRMKPTEAVMERLRVYAGLCEKAAVEPRSPEWFTPKVTERLEEMGLYLVTPDSPLHEGLPGGRVYVSRGAAYVRMHGRLAWYNYGYLDEELEEVARAILEASPERAYIFFNNNHDMLGDGRKMAEIMARLLRA